MSSPSPVTDGQHVWVMTGVGVLKAFDFAGKEIWSRNLQTDYGRFGLNWGYASSPLLRGDALYVQVLHGMKTDDPSYVLKIDKMSGQTLWRVERPTPAVSESPDSYTTPAWIEANGRAELIITGGDVISGHDPATGREYWRADVLNPTRDRNYRIVASPTIVNGLIIAPSRNNPLVAMRPGGNGDVAGSHVAWTFTQGPDVPTPVSDGKLIYVVRDGGVVFALDAKTGATVYGPKRLPPGTYSASPILADGKIYVTTEEDGITTVFTRRTRVRDPVVELTAGRLLAVLPQHGRGFRRTALRPDVHVSVGHRRSQTVALSRRKLARGQFERACDVLKSALDGGPGRLCRGRQRPGRRRDTNARRAVEQRLRFAGRRTAIANERGQLPGVLLETVEFLHCCLAPGLVDRCVVLEYRVDVLFELIGACSERLGGLLDLAIVHAPGLLAVRNRQGRAVGRRQLAQARGKAIPFARAVEIGPLRRHESIDRGPLEKQCRHFGAGRRLPP